jgi:hypothetical protein
MTALTSTSWPVRLTLANRARRPYCLRDTVVVTVEQLLNVHGDVVASTELERAPCTTPGCIGPQVAQK